jgi:hypothetical protein
MRAGRTARWAVALAPVVAVSLAIPSHAAESPHVGCSWTASDGSGRTCTGTEFTAVGAAVRTICLKRKPPKRSVVQRWVKGRWVGQYTHTWYTSSRSTSCPKKRPWRTRVVLEVDAHESGQTRYYRLYMPLSKKKVAVWRVQACAVPAGSDRTCT